MKLLQFDQSLPDIRCLDHGIGQLVKNAAAICERGRHHKDRQKGRFSPRSPIGFRLVGGDPEGCSSTSSGIGPT